MTRVHNCRAKLVFNLPHRNACVSFFQCTGSWELQRVARPDQGQRLRISPRASDLRNRVWLNSYFFAPRLVPPMFRFSARCMTKMVFGDTRMRDCGFRTLTPCPLISGTTYVRLLLTTVPCCRPVGSDRCEVHVTATAASAGFNPSPLHSSPADGLCACVQCPRVRRSSSWLEAQRGCHAPGHAAGLFFRIQIGVPNYSGVSRTLHYVKNCHLGTSL